jgi:hypothetical protein
MENIKRPAYPKPVGQHNDHNFGFTKLEYASLMIAQGMIGNYPADGLTSRELECLTFSSVSIAKAVLQEANK